MVRERVEFDAQGTPDGDRAVEAPVVGRSGGGVPSGERDGEKKRGGINGA